MRVLFVVLLNDSRSLWRVIINPTIGDAYKLLILAGIVAGAISQVTPDSAYWRPVLLAFILATQAIQIKVLKGFKNDVLVGGNNTDATQALPPPES